MCMTESVCVIIVIIFQCTHNILFSMNGLLVCLIAVPLCPLKILTLQPPLVLTLSSSLCITSIPLSLSLSLSLSPRYEYRLSRDYNWNVKNKASKGYEVSMGWLYVCTAWQWRQ